MMIHVFSQVSDHADVDIAIVGAGISGLYCAWRLKQHDPKLRIALVERLDRIGGRLDTDLIEVAPGQLVREEEGGMRFNYDMVELMRLLQAMNLCNQIVPFPMGSNLPGLGNTNRFLVRGRRFTAAEAAAGGNRIWGELYALSDEEKGLSPTDIVTQAYHRILHHNGRNPPDATSPEFWSDFRLNCQWNSVALKDWQLWGLLREMGRSEECIQMLSETIGFAGPFKAPINAGDAMQILADFPKDPSYSTLQRGFGTLPRAVAAALPADVAVLLSTNADRITRDAKGFTLQLTQAPDQDNATPWTPGGQAKCLQARQVILAVAANGLQRLFSSSPALNAGPEAPRLWQAVRASRGMPLLKINLYFKQPWWRDGTVQPPVQFGPNFTDLPINAVYPFYALEPTADPAAGSAPPPTPELRSAAALTLYCDFDNTHFWAGLQNVGPAFESPLQQQQNQRQPQGLYAASAQVVREARRQLQLMFNTDVPDPLLTSYRLWNGEDDFEYAYHQWGVGADDAAVRAYLAAPLPGLHCCNEAYSDMQGWVNGSLRSCHVALAHFGIAPLDSPACLPADGPAMATAPAQVHRAMGLWGA
jgi:monoamine oxidase